MRVFTCVRYVLQVRNFYVGKDHVGDVPLSKKVLAALTTGENKLQIFSTFFFLVCLFSIVCF